MNNLQPLIVIATIANLLALLLYTNAMSQTDGAEAGMYFIYLEMPVLWLITLIATIINTLRRRAVLFSSYLRRWTILTLLFCTPIPMVVLLYCFNGI